MKMRLTYLFLSATILAASLGGLLPRLLTWSEGG